MRLTILLSAIILCGPYIAEGALIARHNVAGAWLVQRHEHAGLERLDTDFMFVPRHKPEQGPTDFIQDEHVIRLAALPTTQRAIRNYK